MTRRLIIIAEIGTPANFLVGVERDYLGLIQFFKYKEGGAYADKEMFLYYNCCSRAILQSAIQLDITGEGIDKLIIVFCGDIRYSDRFIQKTFDIDSNTEVF